LQKKDFEGYSIYRATDPEFNDAKLITNSFGDPVYWKPLARYDVVDSITGPDPIGSMEHISTGAAIQDCGIPSSIQR